MKKVKKDNEEKNRANKINQDVAKEKFLIERYHFKILNYFINNETNLKKIIIFRKLVEEY